MNPARIPPAQRAEVQAASDSASESSFHLAVGLGAALLLLAGLGGLLLRNPRCGPDTVSAEDCPGGQLVGAPRALEREPLPVVHVPVRSSA